MTRLTPPLALLALVSLLAASCSSAKPPPTVGGGAHGIGGGAGLPADAGRDTGIVVETEGGVPSTVTCTYLMAGGTGSVCAMEVEVAEDDVATLQADCTSSSFSGNPGSACSTDSLVGCCTFGSTETGSFSAPSVACYYPGDTQNQASCAALSGTWTTTIP